MSSDDLVGETPEFIELASRVEDLEAARPRKILPDMDAIDEMVQKATRVIEEVQEILDSLRAQGGIEISVTPQGPTQVNVPTVTINVPLRGAKP